MSLPNRVGEKRAGTSVFRTSAKKMAKPNWASNEAYKTPSKTLKNVLSGIEYQLQLLMLFVVTSKSKFKLATEMADAEKFDDLVCCSFDNHDKKIFRFLQAKHSQTPGYGKGKITFDNLKSETGTYSVQKYLESYLNIIVCDSFSKGELKDFILCTNIDFDWDLFLKNWFVKVGDPKEDFLCGGGDDLNQNADSSTCYKFNSHPEIRKDIIKQLGLLSVRDRVRNNKLRFSENLDNFLDKLTFAVNQPSDGNLKNRIKHELRKTFNTQVDIAYGVLFEYMFDWFAHRTKVMRVKGSGRAHFLESFNVSHFFDTLKNIDASSAIDGDNLSYTLEIEKSGIRFRDDIRIIQKIRDFLSPSEKNQFLIVSSTSRVLSVIKLNQAIERFKKQCIFSDPKALKLRLGTEIDPLNVFSSKEKNVLILVRVSCSNPLDGELINKFVEITKMDENKRIVLITHPEYMGNLKNTLKRDYLFLFDINKLSDLTYESQKLVLDTEVTLPSRGKIKLSDLGTRDKRPLSINGETLCTVIKAVIYSKEIYIDRDFDYEYNTDSGFPTNQLVEQRMSKIDNSMHNAVVIKNIDDYDEQFDDDVFKRCYHLQALRLLALSDCYISLGVEIYNGYPTIVCSYMKTFTWQSRFVQTITCVDKSPIQFSELFSNVCRFALLKHFRSYKKLMLKYRAVGEFVICTNIDFASGLKKYFRAVTVGDDRDILNAIGTKYKLTNDRCLFNEMECRFNMTYMITWNAFDDVTDFLKKLVFVVNCDNLKSYSEKLLSEKIQSTNKMIFYKFSSFLLTWIRDYTKAPEQRAEGKRSELMKEDVDRYLKEATNNISNPNSTISSVNITRCCLTFRNESVTIKRISTFLKNKIGTNILLLSTDMMLLTEIKILQMLSWQTRNKHTIFSNTSSLLTSAADSVEEFRASTNKYLIISRIESVGNEVDELITSFCQVAKQEFTKRVILIIDTNYSVYVRCLLEERHHMKIDLIEDQCNTFNDLDKRSQTALLRTKINLFRKKKTLADLLTNESSYNILKGEVLVDLVNISNTGEAIKTGLRRHDVDPAAYVDINHTVTFPRPVLKKECLEINSDDVFVIRVRDEAECDMFLPEEKTYTKFGNENENIHLKCGIVIVIAESEFDVKKCFNAACKESIGLYVHLLEFNENKLEWKVSWPSFKTIRNFMTVDVSLSNMKIEQLPDCSLIIGQRGSGKTTSITNYILGDPFLWSLRIELKSHADDLIEATFGNVRSVAEFLLRANGPAKSTDKLSLKLLEHSLNQDRHVAVFLDDYDDVSAQIQRKVVQLVNALKITHCKVIVAGHCFGSGLTYLGITNAYLNYLSNEELAAFFKSSWTKQSPTSSGVYNNSNLAIFSELVSQRTLKMKLGILHARMLSYIYQDECIKYSQSVLSKPEMVITNIWEIHKKYIDAQYMQRFELFGGRFRASENSVLSENYTKAYGNLALESLFPSAPSELFTKHKLTLSDLEEVGFIRKVENNKIEFIEQSVAEFFIADLLVEALTNERCTKKYQAAKQFLLNYIFKIRNELIKEFVIAKIHDTDDNDDDLLEKWNEIKDCVWVNASPVVLRFLMHPQRYREFYEADILLEKITYQSMMPYNEMIGTILNHLLEKNGESLHIKVNTMFSFEYCCFDELKHLCKLNNWDISSELNEKYLKAIVDYNSFVKLKDILISYRLDKTNTHLRQLVEVLIPPKLESFQQLSQLNNICFYLYSLHQNTITDVENYIKSDCMKFARKIYKSFEDFRGEVRLFNEQILLDLRYLRNFYNSIIFYEPNVANKTKSLISDMYLGEDECDRKTKQGVLISVVFEIFNDQMLQYFTSEREISNIEFIASYYLIKLATAEVNEDSQPDINLMFPRVDNMILPCLISEFITDFTEPEIRTLLNVAQGIFLNDQTGKLFDALMPHLVKIIKNIGMSVIGIENELFLFDPAGQICEYRLTVSPVQFNKAKKVLKKSSQVDAGLLTDFHIVR